MMKVTVGRVMGEAVLVGIFLMIRFGQMVFGWDRRKVGMLVARVKMRAGRVE